MRENAVKHIKKGDSVIVITGKDKGKKGKVISVFPSTGRVIVENVNMVTKHKKPRSMNQTGGILKQEAPVDASNVMLICPKCSQPAKTRIEINENQGKVRVCKECNEVIEVVKNSK